MSWFRQTLVARVRALLREDWSGEAGQRFRQGSEDIGETGRAQLPALVTQPEIQPPVPATNSKYATAISDFTAEEDRKIDAALTRRERENSIRHSELDLRIKEMNLLQAQAEVLRVAKERGLTLYRTEDGGFTLMPSDHEEDS